MLWLLLDLGIILESMGGRSLEFVDFHQPFLEYKRKQVTTNYKSNLANSRVRNDAMAILPQNRIVCICGHGPSTGLGKF